MAADLADVVFGSLGLPFLKFRESRLEKLGVDLLHLVGEVESAPRPLVSFLDGVLDHRRVHGGELVRLPVDRLLEVVRGGLHPPEDPQVRVGVDRLGLGHRPEEGGDAGMPLLLGLDSEGEITAVSLRFACKGFLEIFFRLGCSGFLHLSCLLWLSCDLMVERGNRLGPLPIQNNS